MSQRNEAATLYRLIDQSGRLLYVGITGRGWPQRMREHLRDKAWFSHISRVDLQRFRTMDDALQAEAAAIRSESPLHNVVHNSPQSHKRADSSCPCDSETTYSETIWNVTSKVGHYTRKSKLWLVPELSCDPVVDDVWEESGEDQLDYWVRYLHRNHRDALLSDRVSISWFIAGDKGIFEAAPLAQKHYPCKDFLDHFYWPCCSRLDHDDFFVDFYRLPVVMDRWPALYAALGWRPSPLQPFIPLHSILRSRQWIGWW